MDTLPMLPSLQPGHEVGGVSETVNAMGQGCAKLSCGILLLLLIRRGGRLLLRLPWCGLWQSTLSFTVRHG